MPVRLEIHMRLSPRAGRITRTSHRRPRWAKQPAAYTRDENDFIVKLKEGKQKLPWPYIYRQFKAKFPERSQNALQVHYCTRLKRREGADTVRKPVARPISNITIQYSRVYSRAVVSVRHFVAGMAIASSAVGVIAWTKTRI